MRPILFHLGPLAVPCYAFFVALAFVVALRLRRASARRLGHESVPGYRWVPLGALLGAVAGAKLGMLLFEPWDDFRTLMANMIDLDFTGKTVAGALGGGYLGVEIAKQRVGITRRTGDAFAVALPLGMAIGRLGCFFHGCCSGVAWDRPLAVEIGGISRHPVQLYEAALDLARRARAQARTRRRHRAGTRGRRAGVRLPGARRGGGGAPERQAWPDSGRFAVVEALRVGPERVQADRREAFMLPIPRMVRGARSRSGGGVDAAPRG